MSVGVDYFCEVKIGGGMKSCDNSKFCLVGEGT